MSKEQSRTRSRCDSDGTYNKHGYTEFDMVQIAFGDPSKASIWFLAEIVFGDE